MSFPTDLILTAGTLQLSRPVEADVDQLVAACRDPEIVRFTRMPSPYDPGHARGFVEQAETGAREGTGLALLVRDRAGRVLGSCGLVAVDRADRVAEVGYWVAPWSRRRGIATRATRAVSRWAFRSGGFERLALEAHAINVGSNEVARRAGFVHEGTRRLGSVDRLSDTGPGSPRLDVELWGMLAGELPTETGERR